MYSLSLYNSSLKSQWDNFINESKNGTFLFCRDFIEYHKNRFNDYSILFYKGDSLIAVFPANKLNGKIYSHQGLTYGGLILSNRIKFSDVHQILSLLLSHINEANYSSKIIKQIHQWLHNDKTTQQARRQTIRLFVVLAAAAAAAT